MAFRRGFRRSFRRGARRVSQLNWITAFTGAPLSVLPGTIAYAPLTLQVESETSSDQIIERIRGTIMASSAQTGASGGQCTMGLFVEDAKDVTLGNVGALPDPRGASVEEVEPDKYLWLGAPFAGAAAFASTQLVATQQLDVRVKRRLDLSYQQLILAIANDSNGTIAFGMYLRTLLRERGT